MVDGGGRRTGGRRQVVAMDGTPPRWWARVLVALRWPIVLGWCVVAAAAWLLLPPLGTTGGGLGDVTTADNPALLAEAQAAKDFGVPVLSRIAVVQHDPSGLPEAATQAAFDAARALSEAPTDRLRAAVPVPAAQPLPAVRAPGTTVVTFLYPQPGVRLGDALQAAHEYADALGPQNAVVGVTGSLPARDAQTRTITEKLPLLETVSLVGVLLVVGVAFRSVVAPLLTLAVSGLAFVLVTRTAGALGDRYGLGVPADLEPLMVALLLGVVTDYVVYFLSGLRSDLAAGEGRLDAARRTTSLFGPIVLVAGITVSAGVATLRLADSPPVRAFGPAMALTVLVTLAVSVTLVPALMAILGGRLLWPSRPRDTDRTGLAALLRRGTVRVIRTRGGAVVVAALCLAGLAVVALPAAGLRAGLPFVASLPAHDEVRRAADAAAAGFAPGITSPTLVEVRSGEGPPGTGTALDPAALTRLEDLLGRQPHVAGVLGPREETALAQAAGRRPGLFVRPDGTAAQLLVVLDADPLDATAVDAVDRVRTALPGLIRQAGLADGTRAVVGGDTAAVAAVVGQAGRDVLAVVLGALLVNFVLLVVFLRALVAPVLLLLCTVLSAASTLGLTALVFQGELDHPGVTFFVPLAAGVLLLALGSDYNLFAVGHVWAAAKHRPLEDAMLDALPQSSAAITTAGVALAASLGTLALVPLRQFHELAFALVVGILIDAVVVRTLLAPSLLTVFGTWSGWPGRRLVRSEDAADAALREEWVRAAAARREGEQSPG
jgi:RND superfamily putative drug exporter